KRSFMNDAVKRPLRVKKLNADAKVPTRAHASDAGLDLYSLSEVSLFPHEPVKVPTGIALAVPNGFVGLICDRSSLGSKGIRTLGGVVAAGYRGEVQVILNNLRDQPIKLMPEDKVAQMLILPVHCAPVEQVTERENTTRAEGGFGSTGQ